jgi:alpha-ribazole phosphatase
MKMIYLLRHGETDIQEKKKYFIGQTDLPLSRKGIRQAYCRQKELSDVVFDRIYCSDLRRAYETAQILAENRQTSIHTNPGLREICLGEWEGLSMSRVRTSFPQEWQARGNNMAEYRPPGGESFADLYARVVPIFEDIVHKSGDNCLIVAHAGVNRMILCSILEMPIANLFRMGQDYAGMNIIECKDSIPKIVSMNIRIPDQ